MCFLNQMFRMDKIFLLFSLILVGENALTSQPSYPRLPDTFYVRFNETLYYNKGMKVIIHAEQWYDFPSRRGRIDREDGLHDRYCYIEGMPLTKEPCTHLVVDGIRWIIHPRIKECCQ